MIPIVNGLQARASHECAWHFYRGLAGAVLDMLLHARDAEGTIPALGRVFALLP